MKVSLFRIYGFVLVLVGIFFFTEPAISTLRAEHEPLCKKIFTRIQPRCTPKYSDVSIRFIKDYPDVNEIEIGKQFHITRVDWSYIRDKNFINMIHEHGWSFQGTLNAITSNSSFALKDSNSNPVRDHFKKNGRYIADPQNSEYKSWYRKKIKQWLSFGVDSFQLDEPDGLHHWPVDVAVDFHNDMRKSITKTHTDAVCGPAVSLNLGWNGSVLGGDGEQITELFDFGMSEINKNKISPHFLTQAGMEAHAKGQFIAYTASRNIGIDNYRKAIAGSYANGMLFIVPWDQFAGTKEERVFVKPKDLADLYGFVRANAHFLDGYEYVASTGFDLNTSNEESQRLAIIKGKKISAWVRMKPNDCTSPIVVHLLNWDSHSGEKFELKLRKDLFVKGRVDGITLRRPRIFDAEIHAEAEENHDYSGLVAVDTLSFENSGEWLTVTIPELRPWGIVVINPGS